MKKVVDVFLSYSDPSYVEGATEKGVLEGLRAGIQENRFRNGKKRIEIDVDYQGSGTSITLTLEVPDNMTDEELIEKLRLTGLSVNIEEAAE